ncbi:MAG: hypothetical protein ACKV2V_04420 [Blastocatellia bacterium]
MAADFFDELLESVSHEERPEELLRRLRAQQAEGNHNPGVDPLKGPAANVRADVTPDDNLLSRDHLSLFLRTLADQLSDAASETRATADELETLSRELQAIEQQPPYTGRYPRQRAH